MAKGYKVAPVEGRTIVDPFNTRHSAARTSAPHRRLGYTRIVDAENLVVDPRSGQKVPAERWDWHGKEETVLETSDGFYARAIKDGDLDYVATLDVAADGTAKVLPLDRELLKATAIHKALRARAAKVAEQAKADAASADDEARAYAEAEAAKAIEALDAKPVEAPVAEPTTTPESAA